MTFLAFGNGAGDVFASFAALNSSSPDLSFGALFGTIMCFVVHLSVAGAGVFVTAVVTASVSMIAPNAQLTRRPFLRDALFLLMIGGVFVYVVLDGTISPLEAGMFVGIYALYVSHT